MGAGPATGRREALDAAVQVDPCLRNEAVAVRRGGEEDDEGHRQGPHQPWNQDSLGMADLLDRVSLTDLQRRLITVVKVQPKSVTTHAELITHSSGLVNHALGAHRANGGPIMPDSLLRASKLWASSQPCCTLRTDE